MLRKHLPTILGGMAASFCLALPFAAAAQAKDPQAEQIAKRNATEKSLEEVAVVDRKVMVKMRDGKRMAADIYRPKGAGKVPTIFSRTPYNFKIGRAHV